ncbi:redoxin domain-containing protein [Labilibaculum sp.]|uniref:redoxin domain-containing protein n=1 Tax=Labilibaculum sp. TaxID=2060723 RepID=UPI00356AD16F
MKKIFTAITAIGLILSSCTSADQYKVTGKLEGMTKGKVYLSKLQDHKLVKTDSTEVAGSSFSFEGTLESPEMYFIQLEGQRGAIQFFLENSKITIDANVKSLKNAKIIGSVNHDLISSYNDKQLQFQLKQQKMFSEYQKAEQKGNQFQMDSIEAAFNKLELDKLDAGEQFITLNKNTHAAAFVAYRISSPLETSEIEKIYAMLSEKAKKSPYADLLKEKIELLKSVETGQPAPDFILNTPKGKPLSLSSFKGKVVVIDFWASWCGPCRKENPHMLELYKELHPKGVEFLGVSLDKEKKSWLKAIKDDGLIWNHVSDLKYWDCEAAKLYGITGIPATVVIDQNGNIVAKKVFGDDLKAAIENLIQ